uniref:UTP--glucose-1-phosphate uridylyltransferase n=1 Tax=Meloidogyne hapla TaxID=6305 RepID=A0A1I8BMT6_MELHA
MNKAPRSKEEIENILEMFDNKSKALIKIGDAESERDIAIYRKIFYQFLTEPYKVVWENLRPMPAEKQKSYDELTKVLNENERKSLLNRLVVVKLNGGLGTTMGCKGPKSLVELSNGMNFLEFVLRQHEILNEELKELKETKEIPFLLMNSFCTDTQTKQYLANREKPTNYVECFCQSKCPRIYADTLEPVPKQWDDCPDDGWYPPGHANIFPIMAHCGLLDRLLAEGRDIAFFANIDNTGAVFDERIAKVLADGVTDYILEVTPRTPADGGTLVEIDDGYRLTQLEAPHVPDEHQEEFRSLKKFKTFNTNNIWVNLRAVKEKLGQLKLAMLANEKRLSNGRPILQLEQSIGDVIRNFPGRALAVNVSRRRFLPVKSTRDLFHLRSKCLFSFDSSLCLLQKIREGPLPEVILSTEEFGALTNFEQRIPEIPKIKSNVEKIVITGNVFLGNGIQFNGKNVEIIAEKDKCISISDNSIINSKEEEYKQQNGCQQNGEINNNKKVNILLDMNGNDKFLLKEEII